MSQSSDQDDQPQSDEHEEEQTPEERLNRLEQSSRGPRRIQISRNPATLLLGLLVFVLVFVGIALTLGWLATQIFEKHIERL